MVRLLPVSLAAVLCACGGAPTPEPPAPAAPAAPAAAASAPPAAAAMSPLVAEAMGRVLALFGDPSDKGIQGAFSPTFLGAVPPAKLKEIFGSIRTQLGACKDQKLVSAEGESKAVVRVHCERGEVDAAIAVNPAPPHFIEGLVLKPAR